MTREEREQAIAILENEKKCVNRANENDYCNRDCYNCELVKTDTEILTALDMAIKALEYDDAKYHEEHGEVIVDKAVWEDAKKALEQSHDGCKDCKYETYPEYYYPCCECKQNYTDEWQKKPHWIMKHRTINEVKYHTGLDDMGEEHTIKELIRYEVDEPYCSECGKRAEDISQDYCGYCGARMEVEKNG